MDFLNPKKKRYHQIRLFVGYGLMAVALAISTLILVIVVNGYDIDRHTGDVIQNGLVVIDSHPEKADIYLNGALKGQTDNRLVLPSGAYHVELKHDGYRTWEHNVNLEGGSIEQLAYPFIFPQSLVTSNVATLSKAPSLASQSPDKHWLIVSVPEKNGNFQMFDLNSPQLSVTTLSLPADTFISTGTKHSFTAIEWSKDNIHLLMKHTWDKGSEFIMLDRSRPINSFNLSRLFPSQQITEISLRDKRFDQYYLFDKNKATLTRAARGSQSFTIVASRVADFKAYQADILLYVSQPLAKATDTEVHLWRDSKDYVLRRLPVAPNYMLDIAEFDNRMYVASGSTTDGRVYIYQNPFASLAGRSTQLPQPFRALIVPKAEFVSFSAIARFIAVQGGSNFVVYDAETGRQFRYDIKLTFLPHQKASWMDGHRLMLVSQNKLVVFDFDGTNKQTLNPTSPVYEPFFDRDYKVVLTLNTAKSPQMVLQRTELLASPPNTPTNGQ